MAEQIQITGSGAVGKIRNPLGVVGLTIVTLGVYFFVWYYKINKEMAEMGRARGTDELGTSPATSLMAVLFGWILLFIGATFGLTAFLVQYGVRGLAGGSSLPAARYAAWASTWVWVPAIGAIPLLLQHGFQIEWSEGGQVLLSRGTAERP